MVGSLPTDRGLLRDRRLPLAAICAFVVLLGAWNVHRYPTYLGFDAADHIAYADGLVPGGAFPQHTGEYYTPPFFYAVAGSADWIAAKLGADNPHWPGRAVNILYVLGTVLLVAAIARRLWPGRRRIELGAAAFVAFLPVVVQTEAMFHPETMSLFLCTLALWLSVRTFADPRYAWALGVTLGAAQLVRAFALWTVAAAALALLVGSRRKELLIVVCVAALIPAPWYIHQRLKYGGQPTFPQPVTSTKPLLLRRPLSFYLDPGIPGIVTRPYRPHHLGLAIPTTYDGVWGDFFGVWSWRAGSAGAAPGTLVTTPPASARRSLVIQSLLGLLPTLLAVGGWLAFARRSLRERAGFAVAALPALGIVGYLYFAVAYWTPDGDLLKATYLLTTASGWAIGFGYALDRLKGNVWRVAVAVLALGALVELPFLVYL